MTPHITNSTHAIIIERIQAKTRLELVDRASGTVKILMFKSKAQALSFIKNMSMEDIVRIFDKLKVPSVPMYKKGVI